MSARDRVLEKLIAAHPGIALKSRGDAFQTLARSIVGQQISVKAADSVWSRLAAAFPETSAQTFAVCTASRLRECGLSKQKSAYLNDLAQRFASGQLNEALLRDLDDEALIAELTEVKGIGRWTAEMFLIFYLTRPNVFPVDDLGLQRAMNLHYPKGKPMPKLKMQAIAKRWLPWRSVATWYLWRSLDPIPVEY